VPPSQYNVVANTTYLDAFGALWAGSGNPAAAIQTLAGSNDVATAQAVLNPLLGFPGAPAALQVASGDVPINVAVMLQRAAPPSQLNTLLSGDWADRQSYITNPRNNVFATYGADPTLYASTQQAILQALDNPATSPISLAATAGYSSTAENRTIWLSLTPAQFNTLFNTTLLHGDATKAWTGQLSLPSTIALDTVAGLWVDQGVLPGNPVLPASVPAHPTNPLAGAASVGNSAGNFVAATPAAIAAYYNFPLSTDHPTSAIALVETGLDAPGLLAALNDYREAIGVRRLDASEFVSIGGTSVAPLGDNLTELTLDVSVLSGVAPQSAIQMYGAASAIKGSQVSIFQAYQNAFFAKAEVLSSSWSEFFSMTPNSPFQRAWQDLFVDGLLSGTSVHIASMDQGSNGFQPNGTANLSASTVPAYALSVGGTSIASPYSAASDSTLGTLYELAMKGDPATIFELVAAGLTTLPSKLSTADPNTQTQGTIAPYGTQLTQLIESVWNQYAFVPQGRDLAVKYTQNYAGTGGVDTMQPVPGYQSAFGLTPTSPTGSGRGAPDVAALAGGDSFYAVLNSGRVNHSGALLVDYDWGTSAAAPLWAALTAQFNVIFKDQKLPTLGFYNDLLYIAAAIAPASFNDIVLGNNDSSYYFTASDSGYVLDASGSYNGQHVQPTGVGYAATPGYDLATGLGTPNGLLLARALAQIAHEQMYHDSVTPFLTANGSGWTAGAAESLLIQASPTSDSTVHLSLGAAGSSFSSPAPEQFAWTARLAQQSLQADFDIDLVKMFDSQSHGTLIQTQVSAGTRVALHIDGAPTGTPQAGMTTPFGFADYTATVGPTSFNPDVRVALPVAIAETAGGASETIAVVRLRQAGEHNLTLSLFKVEDYAGTIEFNGTAVRPGDANYQAAAQSQAYATTDGKTSIDGPGYGKFGQHHITNVDAGDIIAMMLTNNTSGHTFFSFAAANETVNGRQVGHVWNYGLNTWGFEDTVGGGDRDYNDLVIGLDFVSTAGHGYLV